MPASRPDGKDKAAPDADHILVGEKRFRGALPQKRVQTEVLRGTIRLGLGCGPLAPCAMSTFEGETYAACPLFHLPITPRQIA